MKSNEHSINLILYVDNSSASHIARKLGVQTKVPLRVLERVSAEQSEFWRLPALEIQNLNQKGTEIYEGLPSVKLVLASL
jgi:hypothetical protein